MTEQPTTIVADQDMERGQQMTLALPTDVRPVPHDGPLPQFRTVAAGERIRRGDRLTISGGRVYLADRAEAARREAAEWSEDE